MRTSFSSSASFGPLQPSQPTADTSAVEQQTAMHVEGVRSIQCDFTKAGSPEPVTGGEQLNHQLDQFQNGHAIISQQLSQAVTAAAQETGISTVAAFNFVFAPPSNPLQALDTTGLWTACSALAGHLNDEQRGHLMDAIRRNLHEASQQRLATTGGRSGIQVNWDALDDQAILRIARTDPMRTIAGQELQTALHTLQQNEARRQAWDERYVTDGDPVGKATLAAETGQTDVLQPLTAEPVTASLAETVGEFLCDLKGARLEPDSSLTLDERLRQDIAIASTLAAPRPEVSTAAPSFRLAA